MCLPISRALRRRDLLATLCLGGLAQAAPAASTLVHVTAVVQRHAAVRLPSVPSSLFVREEDARRGWLRPEAITIEVRANHQDTVLLQLDCVGLVVREAEIVAGNQTLSIDSSRGPALLGGVSPNGVIALQPTFRLADGVAPGAYPWPLRIRMQA